MPWWRRYGLVISGILSQASGFSLAVFANKYSSGDVSATDWWYLAGSAVLSYLCYLFGTRSHSKDRLDLTKKTEHILNAIVEAIQHNTTGVERPRAGVRLLKEETSDKWYSVLFPYCHDEYVNNKDKSCAVAVCEEDRNRIIICRAALDHVWVDSGAAPVQATYSKINTPTIPLDIRSVAACPIYRRSTDGNFLEDVIGTLSLDSKDDMSKSNLNSGKAKRLMESTAKLLSILLSDHYEDIVGVFPSSKRLRVDKTHNNPPVRVRAP